MLSIAGGWDMSVIAQPVTTAMTRSGYMAATQSEYEPPVEMPMVMKRSIPR
jgi:hypothetical protein